MHLLKVRRVNDVSSVVKIGIKELETGLLIHTAHPNTAPFITDAHCSELQRRDMDSGIGRQQSVSTEAGLGWWSWSPDGHDIGSFDGGDANL